MVYRTNNIILNQYLFYKTSVTLPNNSDLTYVPEPCLEPSDGFLTLPFQQSARCVFKSYQNSLNIFSRSLDLNIVLKNGHICNTRVYAQIRVQQLQIISDNKSLPFSYSKIKTSFLHMSHID